MLFSRGPPAGPHLLMEKLRGQLTPDGLEAAWQAAAEEADEGDGVDPMKADYTCMQCLLAGRPAISTRVCLV